MTNKIAFITGINGQDGSYLAELLLSMDNYTHVFGMLRRASTFNTERIDDIRNSLELRYGDLSDSTSILNILQEIKSHSPERIEIYNLGAMSHVKVSFDMPEYTSNIDGLGCLRILESIRTLNLESITRFYQASTSELYGKVLEVPQTEETPFNPCSPYGVAKMFSFYMTKVYRESYGMYACNGILFNHESSRRGGTFVTKKITDFVTKYSGKEVLKLGNLNAKRDWGHAIDYVRGMWMMLQQDNPEDFVLATNTFYSIRDFLKVAFKQIDINIQFKGKGLDELGYCQETGITLVKIDKRYFRPNEVDELLGDPAKAKNNMGWIHTIGLESMVSEMIKKEDVFVNR